MQMKTFMKYLRGSVPDDPYGRGPFVTQTSIPCLLWQLRSIVGVNGLPLRLQCWKLGGRSSSFAGPPGLERNDDNQFVGIIDLVFDDFLSY